MPRTRGAVLVGAAAALALFGTACGTGDDREQAAAAVERFAAAVEARDGEAACAQLAPSLREQLVKDGGPCAEAVLDVEVRGRTAASVSVYDDAGLVELAGGDTLFLSSGRLGWRIRAVGCTTQRNGTYDCQEES
jgi:hypothetical protein